MSSKSINNGAIEQTTSMIHRHVWAKYRAMMQRVRRFIMHDILHADDSPHSLSLGLAIGMFVTFTPTVGLQMVLTAFLSWLMRANKVVGLPLVWISNPATLVPIYYSCYEIGRILSGGEQRDSAWWSEWAHPPIGWWEKVSFYWFKCAEIAVPLWIGGIVVGLATAIPTYYITLFGVRYYRLKRWGQLMPPSYEEREAARVEEEDE